MFIISVKRWPWWPQIESLRLMSFSPKLFPTKEEWLNQIAAFNLNATKDIVS